MSTSGMFHTIFEIKPTYSKLKWGRIQVAGCNDGHFNWCGDALLRCQNNHRAPLIKGFNPGYLKSNVTILADPTAYLNDPNIVQAIGAQKQWQATNTENRYYISALTGDSFMSTASRLTDLINANI